MVVTMSTVKLRGSVLKKLSELKREGESWSDVIARLLEERSVKPQVRPECLECGYREGFFRLFDAHTKLCESIGMPREVTKEVARAVEKLPKVTEVEGVEPATEKQKSFIRDLCRRLGREPPENLEALSKREASKLIDELMGKAEPWRRNVKERGYHEFNTPVKNPEKFAKEGLLVSGKIVVDPERFVKLREGKKLSELPEGEQKIAEWLRDAGYCWLAADGSIARS